MTAVLINTSNRKAKTLSALRNFDKLIILTSLQFNNFGARIHAAGSLINAK